MAGALLQPQSVNPEIWNLKAYPYLSRVLFYLMGMVGVTGDEVVHCYSLCLGLLSDMVNDCALFRQVRVGNKSNGLHLKAWGKGQNLP